MYNWTNDLPEGSRNEYINIIEEFNKNNTKCNKKILEIGTYTGVSLIKIMELIPDSIGYVIDNWSDYKELNSNNITETIEQNNVEKAFYDNIKIKNLENRVNVYKGKSSDKLLEMIISNHKNILDKFDIIYVDGSHRLLDCYTDLILSWELLEKNGLMIIDDYLFNKNNILESPFEAVNTFLNKYDNKYILLSKNYRVFLVKK